MIGVYVVRNLIDGKVYIGQSVTLEDRLADHQRNRNHNIYLTRAMRKHGLANFSIEVLEELAAANYSKDLLDSREMYYISLYESTDPLKGYNLRTGGAHGLHSEASRRRISEATKGKTKDGAPSAEARKGMVFTDERRRKISEAMKGNTNGGFAKSEETKKKISEANTGKKRTSEEKLKMSRAKKGKPAPLRGSVWMHLPVSGARRRILPENVAAALEAGYVLGQQGLALQST